ncbi:Glycosyl transferase, group 1 family [Candidatus Terasakiella magnetica]|uniref:Glycosyl transferase, group 1 family n=1 Tax=Candidatus Terasakiella magnetica TaxID=1867952 RepID=A0A1C3RFX3_9PROT|nr:glycosyltransferase [Candidatus Terasakiella magnetica]SCA56196.1 Glycosyl transferase, group 1 family [Candidatus Terasakiella magnetica]
MAQSKTITYVIGTTDIGGAEMHLLRICTGLIPKGWNVTIFSLANAGKLAEAFAQTGATVVHPPSLTASGPLRKVFRLVQILLQTLRIFLHLLFSRPSIVHFFLPAAYLVGAPLAILAGSKIKLMSRRSLNLYQEKHPKLAKLEHWLHKKMDVILGNSRAVISNLKDDEQVHPAKLGLIYNGIETGLYQHTPSKTTLRDELKLNENALVFILVANLIPYKGHMDLINALGLVDDQLPEDWHLVCAGYDSGYLSKLKMRSTELGLNEKIHFLGQRQDIPDLLQASDVGLLCSHEEGFSNAILEAMASALAMVVTDVGGNGDVVEEGKSGFIVPAHNPEKLGKALVKISHDPQRLKEMGAYARSVIEKDFTLEHCVDQYDQLYQRLLTDKTIPAPIKINRPS